MSGQIFVRSKMKLAEGTGMIQRHTSGCTNVVADTDMFLIHISGILRYKSYNCRQRCLRCTFVVVRCASLTGTLVSCKRYICDSVLFSTRY